MAAETTAPPALAATTEPTGDRAPVAGLDALELGPAVRDHRPARYAAVAWRSLWPKALALALVIGAWQALVLSGWRPPYALPPPALVWRDLVEFVFTGEFWTAVAITLQRAVAGFLVATVIGTLVGLAVARVRPLRAAIGSLITGLQTMPSIVWFMPGILLFGITETTIMFVVVIGAAPAVANGLIGGVDYVPPAWLRAGRALGMRGLTLDRHVILPAALPSFLSGLKQGWAFAWRSLMAGELLVVVAGRGSVGALMQGARELNNATRLLTWIIAVLVIGILVDVAFRAADSAVRRRRGLATG